MGRIDKTPRWHTYGDKRMLCFQMITVENIGRKGTVEWHNEVHTIRISENLVDAAQFTEGCIVYVQGRLQTLQYTDEQSVKHYRTHIAALSVDLVDVELLKNTLLQTKLY